MLILDVDKEGHLFCLHYIFLDRINSSLSKFVQAWNHHPLSSERSLSPNQLWTSGLISSNQDPFSIEVYCIFQQDGEKPCVAVCATLRTTTSPMLYMQCPRSVFLFRDFT